MGADDRPAIPQRLIERRLNGRLQLLRFAFTSPRGAAQRDPAVVDDRDVRRVQPRHAGGHERLDPADGFGRQLGARRAHELNAGAGFMRRFVGEVARRCGRDDDARVGNAGDVAQAQRKVAGKSVARLRFEDRLRGQRADFGQRFTRIRDVQARHARERQAQERFVFLSAQNANVVARRGERHIPGRQSGLDVGELLGQQRTREESRLRIAGEEEGRQSDQHDRDERQRPDLRGARKILPAAWHGSVEHRQSLALMRLSREAEREGFDEVEFTIVAFG